LKKINYLLDFSIFWAKKWPFFIFSEPGSPFPGSEKFLWAWSVIYGPGKGKMPKKAVFPYQAHMLQSRPIGIAKGAFFE
jgi:hypothetical protein